ncbi:hypothetical protein ALC62_04891 [Cyphomyrmex costatus]|uniref:Uncharacterized protein n=1 Tax=Cyphomyrmex costatus TaxID=456900 RepID=A0A195CTW2_9HYME|nr:hypothetical protein ALC62_04891 [Cyphomyrmex costatus]
MVVNDIPKGTKIEFVVSSGEVLLLYFSINVKNSYYRSQRSIIINHKTTKDISLRGSVKNESLKTTFETSANESSDPSVAAALNLAHHLTDRLHVTFRDVFHFTCVEGRTGRDVEDKTVALQQTSHRIADEEEVGAMSTYVAHCDSLKVQHDVAKLQKSIKRIGRLAQLLQEQQNISRPHMESDLRRRRNDVMKALRSFGFQFHKATGKKEHSMAGEK